MILGLGNDIIEIERIRSAISKPKFSERVFTLKELEEMGAKGDRAESYAGKFAAKEAVSKALGTGVRGFELTDIEILKDELGKPSVYLKNSLAEKYSQYKIEISISHCRDYAAAVAIIFKG